MNKIEKRIYEDIINLIKDNLRLLIQNNNSSMYYLKEYCKCLNSKDLPIDYNHLIILTEECLYALLNADFLYNYKDVK